MSNEPKYSPEVLRLRDRREFIKRAAAGTICVAFAGALYRIASDDLTRDARAQTRADGKARLPPGQRVISKLKPMGGDAGSPLTKDFRLKVHGEVDRPFEVNFAELLALPQTEQQADVHCVTGWSLLGSTWKGVRVSSLANLAKVRSSARYVIFEAAHGYTSNVPIALATASNAMVTYRQNGVPLPARHGAPVRALVPDLYFWKSAKWLTGIRFVGRDKPGYWEVRGYHNRADPWKEERHG